MNTICNFLDIDIYLLSYFDIKSRIQLGILSKGQYEVLFKVDYIRQLILLKREYQNKHIVDYAASHNYLELIVWLKENNQLKYSIDAITGAAENGHVRVLEWFDKFGTKFVCADYVIELVAKNGHVAVLEWFRKSRYVFGYANAVDMAAGNGYVEILEWFDRYEFDYVDAIDRAAAGGYVEVLNWFNGAGHGFEYTSEAIDRAAENGYVNVLDWFSKSAYEFVYSEKAIDRAAENGHIGVLKWFDESEYEFKCTVKAIDKASENGYIEILNWFDSVYKFNYTSKAIDYAVKNGHLSVLCWYHNSRHEVMYTKNMYAFAAQGGYIEILQWLRETEYILTDEYIDNIIYWTIIMKHGKIINWLIELGYDNEIKYIAETTSEFNRLYNRPLDKRTERRFYYG